MGNRGSHKEIEHSGTNGKRRIKTSKRSLNSKSFDNFLNTDEPDGIDENNTSQNRSVTKLEVKIFRSYTNLSEFASKKYILGDKPTNIRIYKKSSQKFDFNTFQNNDDEKLLRSLPRSNSLPKSFGKSKVSRYSAVSISSNENANSLKDGRYSRLSLPDRSSNSHKVTKVEFASGQVLEERLKHFEKILVKTILEKFATFSLPYQVSLIPLALFPPTDDCVLRAHSLLTLKCYIEDKTEHPFDPVQANHDGQCALFVPPSHLLGLHYLKENPSDENISKFMSSMFESMSLEAAADLGRMYEYQISLLSSDFSISLLTKFIAERIVSYITSDMKVPLVDRNSLVVGAVRGRVDKRSLPPAVVSVILGMKELKWDVFEILDKPGVRKSVLLDEDGTMLDEGPFQFFSSLSSDHMTYGYRGQLLELDFSRGVYKHHKTEVNDFPDEVLWRYDDFHRNYPPHFHLVGDKFFKQFVMNQDHNCLQHADLNNYTRKFLETTAYNRDDITALFVPMNRMNLSDELIENCAISDLVKRVPGYLLDRSNSPIIRATSPILSTDFPISESDLSSPMRCVFTSTPATDQNRSNHFPACSHQSPFSSHNEHSFT